MGLFSMSGKKRRSHNNGSGYYQQQGFMGKLGGFMGSFSSSARRRQGYGYGYDQPQPVGQAPFPQVTQPQTAPTIHATVACPKCGANVPVGSKFCLECGEKLGGGFCAQCGLILPPNAKFCPECGAPRS